MERGRVRVTLPDAIVERILSMVPFPYVFKARVLSKSWLARFSLIQLQKRRNGASKKKVEMKRLATSFQEQIGEFSVKSKTFFPTYVSKQLFFT